MKEKIALVTGLIMIVGACFGVFFYAESRYALGADIKRLEQRLDYKIMSDQYRSIQDRIWKIEDRYRGKVMDKTVIEELRQLNEMKNQLDLKLKKMETK